VEPECKTRRGREASRVAGSPMSCPPST
jgi:hypothetical protein